MEVSVEFTDYYYLIVDFLNSKEEMGYIFEGWHICTIRYKDGKEEKKYFEWRKYIT